MADREETYQDNNGEINVNTEMDEFSDSSPNESIYKKAMRIAQNAPLDVANHLSDEDQ